MVSQPYPRASKYDERGLREFIMKLHTGETLVSATKEWAWPAREKLGQRYLTDLARDIISTKGGTAYPSELPPAIATMRSLLELDGYIFRDGTLFEVESSVINEQAEQGYLSNLVTSLNLPDAKTIQHHLDLSQEHYQNQKWDDSIGNSRKFLEAILQQVADNINKAHHGAPLSISMANSPRDVRDYLVREGLLESKERDALAKVYGLLSETGSHPHIAEKDQARLMWQLALTFSQFCLLRYEGMIASP